MPRRAHILAWVMLVLCAPAAASRDIPADAYLDKLHGMWLGQILGNYAGRDTEGDFRIRGGNPAAEVPFVFADPWQSDDDTCFEYLYGQVLAAHPSPSAADIRQGWQTHVPVPSFYIANRQARWLIADGLSPPDTGSIGRNMHWYAIDSQITTEAVGAAAPGMRQRAADLAGTFGSVTNDGYPVHAAQFYAAMVAAATFESDVEVLVAAGRAVVPDTSRTAEIVDDVRQWFQDDGDDDWRSTHEKIYDKYVDAWGSNNRYRGWIESTVNTGLTTMAILYGGGDFKDTVQIGVLGGFDCDCNPATAGGLIGMIDGYSGLPADLTAAASDALHVNTLQNLVADTTLSQMAADFQAVAEQQILLAGGAISGAGAARTYHLPDADPVAAPVEKPDPAGPAGLVGAVRDAGGTVTVSGSFERHDPHDDRGNIDAIADGITDVSYNGHLPYWTYPSGPGQPPEGEHYQLNFDREVTFTSAVFHEGDIRWESINANPKDLEPRGGYFLDLTVEVRREGEYHPVNWLALSEPLDPFEYFQVIELTFDPAVGGAVRIRGQAGGTWECTSIVELEAYGKMYAVVPGDADIDGTVALADLSALAFHWGDAAGARWADGDFDADGAVTLADLSALAFHWGHVSAPPAVPEPGSAALIALGGAALLRRRRRSR